MYFLALSQAPPPVHIEIATNRPVTMVPKSIAPRAAKAATGNDRDDRPLHDRGGLGITISLMAAVVMSTALPYSGLPVPSMMPEWC